ncbi:putative sterigmatocystin biosynthesis peroxidase stcC [Colletotrichum trifolii]|uniref:Putative sterigmatocystin biosynthesis peroxidase stcC n=1 Tax=Colletotrichum trifolii TaxID=5466 RepID=A0A4R8RCF4_COLTR|nr:putative sterigmatocystin biosynthesis peroxidase stcC [Colletotrichum trifolii]
MLNTLANHGFLPHNGRHITQDVVTKALKDAVNIAEDIAVAAFQPGLKTNPDPNANFIDLDMLNLHNAIEHDGSLSRRDEFFDPNNHFDGPTFDQFLSYFGPSQNIDVSQWANARARHVQEMSRVNPSFNVANATVPLMLGESALMLAVYGRPDKPIAKRSYLEYFFSWTPNDTPIAFSAILQISGDLVAHSPPDVPLTFAAPDSQ